MKFKKIVLVLFLLMANNSHSEMVFKSVDVRTNNLFKEKYKSALSEQNNNKSIKLFQEAIKTNPASELLIYLHEQLLLELSGVEFTPEAKKLIDDRVKASKGWTREELYQIEYSGVETLRRECDEIINDKSKSQNDKLTAKIVQGYSYLAGTEHFETTKVDINKAISIFNEIIKNGSPEWVYNGLIGLAFARTYEAKIYKVPPDDPVEIYKEIIKNFPKSKHAALAQTKIVEWYISRGYNDMEKINRAKREIEELKKYQDYEFDTIEPGIRSKMKDRIEDLEKDIIKREELNRR